MQRLTTRRLLSPFLHTYGSPVASTSKLPHIEAASLPTSIAGGLACAGRGQRRCVSTVNQDEINHFSSLAATWWDETGSFKLLQRMNKVRVQFLRERLLEERLYEGDAGKGKEALDGPNFLQGKRVLDVGCGGGLFAERLARLGATTLAIDASPENVAAARTHASQDPHLVRLLEAGQLEYRNCAAEDLLSPSPLAAHEDAQPAQSPLNEQQQQQQQQQPEPAEQFDIVCAMEVLEHVSDPRGFLKCLADLTKPGGQIVLSTISRTALAKIVTVDLAESALLNFAPKGSHTYSKFIKPQEIENYFVQELGWTKQPGPMLTSQDGHLTPEQRSLRYAMETRGTTYIPWKGEWVLLGKDDPERGLAGELEKAVNYFWGARKPLSM